MPASIDDELVIDIGSTEPFDVLLRTQAGLPEALGSADRASLAIRASESSPDILLQRSTNTGTATIVATASESKVTCTLALQESEELPAGTFVGQLAVRFGTDANWKYSFFFPVRFRRPIAVKV